MAPPLLCAGEQANPCRTEGVVGRGASPKLAPVVRGLAAKKKLWGFGPWSGGCFFVVEKFLLAVAWKLCLLCVFGAATRPFAI